MMECKGQVEQRGLWTGHHKHALAGLFAVPENLLFLGGATHPQSERLFLSVFGFFLNVIASYYTESFKYLQLS
jgi:hypothetical protein